MFKKEVNAYEEFDLSSEYSSSFNIKVNDIIINSYNIKSYQFVEKVNDAPKIKVVVREPIQYQVKNIFTKQMETFTKYIEKIVEMEDTEHIYKGDMCKSRRNTMFYNIYEYPVYSVLDNPTRYYGGELVCGLYYIRTFNTYPFRGCGWYLSPIVIYGIEQNLITKEDIVMEFIPNKTLPANYFKKYITYLLDNFKNDSKLQKIAVNTFIGLLGRVKRNYTQINFTKSIYDASNKIIDDNTFIDTHTLNNGELMYEVINFQDIIPEKSSYLVYKHILELEAIELHRLEQKVLSQGAIILDRNTDAIRYHASKEIVLDDVWYDGENKTNVMKYQRENNKPLQFEKLRGMERKYNENILNEFEYSWNVIPDTFNSIEDFEKYADILIENKQSIFINGRAGRGKTTLINKIIENIESKNIKYNALCPTNKAINKLNCSYLNKNTLYKFYFKYRECKKSFNKIMKNLSYLFIDEVSMMSERFYRLFLIIKKCFPHLKFNISGDFTQLPPIKDDWIGDYEDTRALFELCDGNKLILTKSRRADKKLDEICDNVNDINIRQFPYTKLTMLNLAYTHKTRKEVNINCMEEFIKTHKKPTIDIQASSHKSSQDIKLCEGMPVICYKTDKRYDIFNNETYTVEKITASVIIMAIPDTEYKITIPINEFNKYLNLGFCITIHSSQGETFTEPYTIYDWGFSYMCEKAKYVAVSRATRAENIQIVL